MYLIYREKSREKMEVSAPSHACFLPGNRTTINRGICVAQFAVRKGVDTAVVAVGSSALPSKSFRNRCCCHTYFASTVCKRCGYTYKLRLRGCLFTKFPKRPSDS